MNLWRGYCNSLLSHLLHHPSPENYSSHHLTDCQRVWAYCSGLEATFKLGHMSFSSLHWDILISSFQKIPFPSSNYQPIPQGFSSVLLKPSIKVGTHSCEVEWWRTLMVECVTVFWLFDPTSDFVLQIGLQALPTN